MYEVYTRITSGNRLASVGGSRSFKLSLVDRVTRLSLFATPYAGSNSMPGLIYKLSTLLRSLLWANRLLLGSGLNTD